MVDFVRGGRHESSGGAPKIPATAKQIQEIKHGTKSLQALLPLLGYLSDDVIFA